MEEEFLDFTKLKYVLYARKSTEDESRHIRSTGDQIAECRRLAAKIGLTVVEHLRGVKYLFRVLI